MVTNQPYGKILDVYTRDCGNSYETPFTVNINVFTIVEFILYSHIGNKKFSQPSCDAMI